MSQNDLSHVKPNTIEDTLVQNGNSHALSTSAAEVSSIPYSMMTVDELIHCLVQTDSTLANGSVAAAADNAVAVAVTDSSCVSNVSASDLHTYGEHFDKSCSPHTPCPSDIVR